MKSRTSAADDLAGSTNRVDEAVAVIRSRCDIQPVAGIILGTGLGSLADQIEVQAQWPYSTLPGFARSTADGHRGRLLIGRLNNVPIVALDGRFHLYEGYSFEQVTFPVHVLSALGIRLLIVSNASGGLNVELNPGDIMLIDDHVNLMWSQPAGANRQSPVGTGSEQSTRSLYDPRWLQLAEQAAASEQIVLRRGTYIAMLGPNYETRAEARWLRTLGDVVGMSTIPELLVAAERRIPTIAFSMVANVYRLDSELQSTSSQEVQQSVASAAPKLQRIVTRLLRELEI